MAENQKQSPRAGVKTRTVEIAVAAVIFALGLLVVVDSRRIGAGWGAEGPQAGYFPFYVGSIICVASAWILLHALFGNDRPTGRFVSKPQLKMVLSVLWPSVVFVGAIYLIGIYVAAALFIGVFMRWHGRFRMVKVWAVSVAVPLALFFMFEIWFLVPLPKGPIESLLGY